MPSLVLNWTRSTYCADGACVEVAKSDQQVLMRDSKNPEGPFLCFSCTGMEAGWPAGRLAGDEGLMLVLVRRVGLVSQRDPGGSSYPKTVPS